MRLLQFSTSHYCRKARLALGYKQISFEVENLTPGLHALRLRPLTGATTTPVLLPEQAGHPGAIGDSTAILRFLDRIQPQPALEPEDPGLRSQAWMVEDWLDESIGTATRFVYYHFRSSGEGKALDSSWSSQMVIQIVRSQYGITETIVKRAEDRLLIALEELGRRWQSSPYLVGDRPSIADIAAAALLSPLARIPHYRETYPWLFEQIRSIHHLCGETLPPGL